MSTERRLRIRQVATGRDVRVDASVSSAAVRALIAAGESQTLEFKTSFRCEAETGRVNRDLQKVVAKTIAGFLNAQGGVLLIGIADDGTILGIEADLMSLSRQSLDRFELALRTTLGTYLGPEISPLVSVDFVEVDLKLIARISCERYGAAVYFQDGDQRHFYVRDGNRTQPLDVRAAHEYISSQLTSEFATSAAALRDIVLEALQERLGTMPPPIMESESLPPWLRVGTRRVLDLYLRSLAGSRGWKRLHVISPWISAFDTFATLTFADLLKRLREDQATAYIVTRPPIQDWHSQAIALLGESTRANIVLVPDLHVKLYTATTDVGSFAMLGSANFTQQSLINREIGVLINGYAEGRSVVSELHHEAAQIYRSPSRRLIYQAAF